MSTIDIDKICVCDSCFKTAKASKELLDGGKIECTIFRCIGMTN